MAFRYLGRAVAFPRNFPLPSEDAHDSGGALRPAANFQLPEVLQPDAVESDPSAGLNAGDEPALVEIVLCRRLFRSVETRCPLAAAAQHYFGRCPAAAAAIPAPLSVVSQ